MGINFSVNNSKINFNPKGGSNVTKIIDTEKVMNTTNQLLNNIENAVTEEMNFDEIKSDIKENVNNLKEGFISIVQKLVDKNAMEQTGAKIVDKIKSMAKSVDTLIGSLIFGQIKEYTVSNIGKVKCNEMEKDDNGNIKMYLNGEKIVSIYDGNVIDEQKKIIYFSDGSYLKFKGNYGYDPTTKTFDNIVGVKYNIDKTIEVYEEIDNINSDVYKKVYGLDGNINCYNENGELLGIYNKDGTLVENQEKTSGLYGLDLSIENLPGATFDYETCTFKIPSVDGACDHYTISPDGKYTYYNSDGSYYKINYGKMQNNTFSESTAKGSYQSQSNEVEKVLTEQGINYKKITNYNTEGEIVNSKVYNISTKEVIDY